MVPVFFCLGVFLGLFPASPVRADDRGAKNDLDKLQGHWVVIASTADGRKTAMGKIRIERTIEGKNYTVTIHNGDDELVLGGTIKLDPTKKPRTIDATRTDGSDQGKAMLGIYELEGDTQRVCFAPVGRERPTEFSSKAGTGHVLTIWKRAEAKPPAGAQPVEKTEVAVVARPANAEPLRQIVDECNRKAIEEFKKGDMLAVARGYADDATIYSPGRKFHGRKAIDTYWQSIKGAKDWKLETFEVGGTPEAIYEVGKSTLTTEANGKPNTYACDYVVIWKRQKNGSYLAHTDIYN
jgi:uncharacterized protein (TIGR03067 family)